MSVIPPKLAKELFSIWISLITTQKTTWHQAKAPLRRVLSLGLMVVQGAGFSHGQHAFEPDDLTHRPVMD